LLPGILELVLLLLLQLLLVYQSKHCVTHNP
jgi:hypothetical protein